MAEQFEINKGREDPKFRRFLVIMPTNGMRQNAFSGIGSLFRQSVRDAYNYNQLNSSGLLAYTPPAVTHYFVHYDITCIFTSLE